MIKYSYIERLPRKDEGLVISPYAAHMKCINLVGRDKIILDAGCSYGYIANELRKKGCRVAGIEIDPVKAEKAKQFCENVHVGDIENIELNYSDYFDVILFADILEHLRYPGEVLRKFRKYLKNTGFIVASIPNIANYTIRGKLLFGNFDADGGILNPEHVRFFTKKRALAMFKQAGYAAKIVDVTTNLPAARRIPLLRSLARSWMTFFGYQFIIKAYTV
ncbi:MAG: class I SAM-dependent methyltransferase [Candidatus Omnitrophota bacterium]